MSEDDTGALARVADVTHAMCDVSDRLVADLGHICEGSGMSAVIEMTALPLSPPAPRIIAKDPDLVPRLASAADECELAFASPPDASPAIECLSPELALRSPQPAQSSGLKAGARLVDAVRKRLPITAFGLAALLMLTGTRRTVLMLAGCQALSMTGGSIVGLTGAIVGNMLTPDKALSTLPIAVQQAGVMAATIPMALLMARIGRRPGFWLGTAIGGVGAVIATWAIFRSSFEWFCFGTFLLGANRGATQQYRFAAAEIADEAFRSKAISLVLAGGVVSAVFGAEVAKWSRDLFEPVLFAGCYALILVLFLASAVLLYFVELPRPATPVLADGGRPLREIAREPTFIAAAVAAMIAYGVMSLVMTATPIAMLDCGHEFAAAAFVIQWHSLGMFAPSFVTGHLINRLGLTRIMLTGAVLLLLCSFINLSGLATLNFWAANVALGVGWNFLFVGATTLLTRTYAGPERGKVQALNDFLVFGTVTLSSFASGAMLSGAGWIMVQIAVMPFVVVAGVAVLWWRHRDASGTAMLRPAEPV